MPRWVGCDAKLIQGHKGVIAAILPFAPSEAWKTKPVPLDDRREGWPIEGRLNNILFKGWIGFRWGKYFVIVDEALCKKAKAKVGDTVDLALKPTRSIVALRIAKEQAKLTTAPKRKPTHKPKKR